MVNIFASHVEEAITAIEDTTISASAMNATEFYQHRHKWAQALRVRDRDIPAEVVWAYSHKEALPTADEVKAARSMVKRYYLDE